MRSDRQTTSTGITRHPFLQILGLRFEHVFGTRRTYWKVLLVKRCILPFTLAIMTSRPMGGGHAPMYIFDVVRTLKLHQADREWQLHKADDFDVRAIVSGLDVRS